MRYLTEIKALAERLWVIPPSDALGCSDAEIQAIEVAFNIKLPEAYREFLAWVGKSKTLFFRDYSSNKNRLVELQQHARNLLEENNFSKALPPNTYVFVMHEGYNFFFFDLNGLDNPPLHFYMEGEENFRENEFCSFTDFLEYHILAHYIMMINGSMRENITLLGEQYWKTGSP